jgi:hypothetical protein
MSKVRLEYLSE